MTSWSKKLPGCFWFLGRHIISSGWVSDAAETLSIFWGCVLCKPALQALCSPSFNTEERAWIRDRDINGLTDKRTLRSEARSPGQHRSSHCAPTTAPRWRRACRTKRHAPLLGKRGRLLIKGKLTAGWLISYQGNQQRGHTPHHTVDKLSQRRVCACSVMAYSATPWTVTRHTLLSMEFSRQGYWSGLPFPHPGIEPTSLALASRFFTTASHGKPIKEMFWFKARTMISWGLE